MKNICLIACASGKRDIPAPAQDLYQSHLFTKSVQWMNRQQFDGWFILSAKHGIVGPDQVLEPYNLTLNTMDAYERRLWAENVVTQLLILFPETASITFLAGLRYREHLVAPLRLRGYKIQIPMQALGIGKQLQWLDSH